MANRSIPPIRAQYTYNIEVSAVTVHVMDIMYRGSTKHLPQGVHKLREGGDPGAANGAGDVNETSAEIVEQL